MKEERENVDGLLRTVCVCVCVCALGNACMQCAMHLSGTYLASNLYAAHLWWWPLLHKQLFVHVTHTGSCKVFISFTPPSLPPSLHPHTPLFTPSASDAPSSKHVARPPLPSPGWFFSSSPPCHALTWLGLLHHVMPSPGWVFSSCPP